MSLVSVGLTGRLVDWVETVGLDASEGGSGWLIGRLDVVVTNLGLSCATAWAAVPTAKTTAASVNNAPFFRSIKTYPPFAGHKWKMPTSKIETDLRENRKKGNLAFSQPCPCLIFNYLLVAICESREFGTRSEVNFGQTDLFSQESG